MNGAPRIDDTTISGERAAVPSATQNADMRRRRLQVVALTPSGPCR